ncbi:hypothetical protein TNCV_4414751 [Trichonephila clavipes]|uniref:Uncharacterized protein n=1 Tax=Trichonephila clavipes TaxID=2585209 RepID=A0A8X6V4E9_TRICX|nr:hypothetical protein TNCV_4414751 [Trichonephila clavipes]
MKRTFTNTSRGASKCNVSEQRLLDAVSDKLFLCFSVQAISCIILAGFFLLEIYEWVPMLLLPMPIDSVRSRSKKFNVWVPSYVGINGNEKVDFLARTEAEEEVSPTGFLTFILPEEDRTPSSWKNF